MRLSGVEAVARNPISVTGGIQGVSDYGGIAGLAAGGMAAAFAYPPPPPAAEYGYDAAAGGGMEYGPAGGGGGGGGGGVYGMQEAYLDRTARAINACWCRRRGALLRRAA